MTTPRTVEEITPAWLGAALAERHPGASVTDLAIEDVMRGMATKVRVRPHYGAGGPPLPETLIVKGHLAGHELGNSFSFELEMRSYLTVVPTVKSYAPTCYFAGDGAGGPVVILEDLRPRNVRFLDPTVPLTFEQAGAFLEVLARVHAVWWDHPSLAESGIEPWLAEDGAVRRQMDDYFRNNARAATWNEMAALPRGAAIPLALRDQRKVEAALDRFMAFRRTLPRTLSHGDEHPANLYLEPDGTPGLLDWQSRKEPWSVAFAYFIILGLDIIDRRAWERPLLERYLAALQAAGAPAPDFDAAWLAYRESAIFPYQVWFTNRPAWQPEHFIAACASRAAWAAWDLEVFRLGET